MDLAETFALAKAFAGHTGWLRERFGAGHYLFHDLIGLLPLRAHGAEGWEPIEPRLARPKDFRPIIAVRGGALEEYPSSVELNPVHGTPTARGAIVAAGWVWLKGDDLVDLLACDWELQKPPRRLLGQAATLGLGCEGGYTTPAAEGDAGDAPVRLCRSVAEWIGCLFQAPAALPLGSAEERAATIRRFGAGVVCQDLDHGLEVERLLRRDLPAPPRILIREAA